MTSLNEQRIAVTGATGFLGSHIALALCERGATVRAVVRTPSKGAFLEERGVEIRRADLSDQASLTEAFSGCDAVISNAALAIRGRACWEAYYQANVVGTENVFKAIAEAKVPRAVQVSTVGVYRMRSRGPIDETSPLRMGFELDASLFTTNWRYAATKSRGEQAARAIAAEAGIALTTLRPGPIYGSRDHKMTRTFARQLERRCLIVPDVRLPMIHAGDVALAIACAVERPESAGRAYNVTGPSVSLPEVFRLIRELTHSSCRLYTLPLGLGRDFDDSRAITELGLNYRSLREGWSEALGVES
jgi:nucleoside-diphosphate-sugar epimerase